MHQRSPLKRRSRHHLPRCADAMPSKFEKQKVGGGQCEADAYYHFRRLLGPAIFLIQWCTDCTLKNNR